VCDSAASRALGHNGIRSAPTSYAINVNVNVEWWNPDQLYTHFQDKERDAPGQKGDTEGTTYTRTTNPYRNADTVISEMLEAGSAAYDAVKDDPAKLYDLAQQQLHKGVNDVEGIYKQPNPYGADTDPSSIASIGRNGEGVDGVEERDFRTWYNVYAPSLGEYKTYVGAGGGLFDASTANFGIIG